LSQTIRRDRLWRWVVALWLSAVVPLAALWDWFRGPAAVSRSPALLLQIASWFGSVVFPDPALAIRIQITRCALVLTAAALAAIVLLERDHVVRSIRDLIDMQSDPLNLAIFRIVVFWQIYTICYPDFIARIASLPAGLQYPPQTGIPRIGILAAWAFWPAHLVDAHTIFVCVTAMKWAAVAGAIGLFSRSSAALVTFLFLFAWGRLQWYGKIDHHHHLLWFAMILMLSPCGDALSLDSIFSAIRRANRGITAPLSPGRRYGTPLAFCMLLIGVIYLFPGLWKISRSGLDWALSDSPRFMMQTEWKLYGDWAPLFRFDQHPALYHLGALSTMLFELSFFFLLLFRRTRRWAPLSGFGFHWMTSVTLNIQFETLRNCYVVFVDWSRLFGWIGRKLFPEDLAIFFPPSPEYRRTVAVLRGFDVLGRIQWTERQGSVPDLSYPATGVIRDRKRKGFALHRLAAARMPLLWPALPFLYLISYPLARGGSAMAPVSATQTNSYGGRPTAVIVIGSLLLIASIWAGAIRAMDGWPFACYPPFDGLSEPSYRTLQIWATFDDGQERLIVPDDYRRTFGNRWSNLLQRILATRDESDRDRRLSLVWKVLARQESVFAQITRVRFVSVRSFVNPNQWKQAPDDPQLLLDAQINATASRQVRTVEPAPPVW
jgi:hypothetical protein